MGAVFTVEGSGCAIYVMQGRKAVAGPYHTYDLAEEARERAERKARCRVRPCLRCRAEFESEGAHNRMCPRCRETASEIFTGRV